MCDSNEDIINQKDNIENIEDLKEVIGQKDFSYFQTLINFGVGADYKNSRMNILYIGPSCLGLGNSLYYKEYIVNNPYMIKF